jgi:hypothetical protein
MHCYLRGGSKLVGVSGGGQSAASIKSRNERRLHVVPEQSKRAPYRLSWAY